MILEVNGFKFNLMGQITQEPDLITLDILNETLLKLYEIKEYISASRIQHKINKIEFGE